MEIVFFLFIFVLGCVIGSFLNVVADRLPYQESLLGRSHCDICKRTLTPRELVPLFSYALQRGKSYCCKRRLKAQYSIVEVVTGGVFVIVTLAWAMRYPGLLMWTQLPLLGILLLMAALTVVISVIDIKHQIIPDELQLVLLGLAFVHIFLLGTSLLQVALSLLVPLPILLIYLVTRGRGMGFGDVKLEVGLGLWLGLGRGLLGIYGGFLIGAVYGVILMLLKKAKGKTHIAFGPFLLLGAWIAYFLSTGWYAYCLSFLGIR